MAQELADIEALEAPVKQRESRTGLRMPEPVNGKGYGPVPVAGMPVPVPYGVPQRPGFPAQTIVAPNWQPRVAPGVEPPKLAAAPTANLLLGGVPGSMLGPGGVVLPPPNLPANFAQMQADFQAQYLAGDRGGGGGGGGPSREDRGGREGIGGRMDRPFRNEGRRF